MSAFQDALSCILLESFHEVLVDPYYEPLSWFMILTAERDGKKYHQIQPSKIKKVSYNKSQ